MIHTRTLTLPDDRALAYAEYGDPEGYPLLWCHGNPGSHRDPDLLEPTLLRRARVRVIAPDRPGIGESTFKPQRKLNEWPTDVAALTAALHLDRFALLGLSAGAPSALAVASSLSHQLTRVAIVSGFGILEALPPQARRAAAGGYFAAARRSFWLVRWIVWLMRSGLRDPEKLMARVNATLPPADQRVLADPRTRQTFLADLQEATRQGTRGLAWDAVIAARPWGINFGTIGVPITFWHGDADRNAPPAMAAHLHRLIPSSRLRVFPGEGHFSVALHHFEEILDDLIVPREFAAEC